MLNVLICQKEIRILPGNVERGGVGGILLAIPENPHALFTFLEGGAARASKACGEHSRVCLEEACVCEGSVLYVFNPFAFFT